MRYITWRLVWDDKGYGYGPEEVSYANGSRIEASSWVTPSVETGTILGYLYGDIDISILSNWGVTELTQSDALTFAKTIDPAAAVSEVGIIILPIPDTPNT